MAIISIKTAIKLTVTECYTGIVSYKTHKAAHSGVAINGIVEGD